MEPSNSQDLPTGKQIQQLINRDTALVEVARGIGLENFGQHSKAVDHYTDGLEHLDRALAVHCEDGLCDGTEWDHIRSEQEKMRYLYKDFGPSNVYRTAFQVLDTRMTYLKLALENSEVISDDGVRQFAEDFKAGSYDHTAQIVSEATLKEEVSLDGTEELSFDLDTQLKNSTELICIPDGVQVFFVSPEGAVGAASLPASLKIFQVKQGLLKELLASTTFLQIGDWHYPLFPGKSPSVYTDYGAYILPDRMNSAKGSCLGIVLGSSVNAENKKKFFDLMKELTSMKETNISEKTDFEGNIDDLEEDNTQKIKDKGQTSPSEVIRHRISKKVLCKSQLTATRIQTRCEKLIASVHEHSMAMKGKIKPSANPLIVNPVLVRGIKAALAATTWTYKKSKKLFEAVGETGLIAGRYVAPNVTACVQTVLPHSWSYSTDLSKQSVMDKVYDVTTSGFQGLSTVSVALDEAAHALATSLIDETVVIVHLKYGEAAADAAHASGNLIMTGYTLHEFGPIGVAKHVAKHTGNVMVEDYTNWKNSMVQSGKVDDAVSVKKDISLPSK